jgi:uncharacterized protein (TIGR02147 family)
MNVPAPPFDFENYKAFLKAYESSLPKNGRGFRSGLARRLGCQSAYVSLVLNGHNHFTLDQAYAVAEHLRLNEREAKHFMLLVQIDRASDPGYRAFLERERIQFSQENRLLQNRIQGAEALSEKNRVVYYSDWSYAAAHVMTSIPRFQNSRELEAQLGLPRAKFERVSQFLVDTGLVVEREGKLKIGPTRVHLPGTHPLVAHHHSNWRAAAMRAIENESPEAGLHYSSVVSLSAKDARLLREKMMRWVEEFNAIVAPSSEETLMALTLDFFSPLPKGKMTA